METELALSKDCFFHHEDRNISFIKTDLNDESFVLKTEVNLSKTSSKAGKIVGFLTPVVSLAAGFMTTSSSGFSFFGSEILDKVQFLLISLLFAGIYLVPAAVALVITAAMISTLIDRNSLTTKNFSTFVSIPEKIQDYIRLFNPEIIHNYSDVYENVMEKQKELDEFTSLTEKVDEDFALDKEAEAKINRLNKEINQLKSMAENILLNELDCLLEEENEKNIKSEVDDQIEIAKLAEAREEKLRKEKAEVESKILYELANEENERYF